MGWTRTAIHLKSGEEKVFYRRWLNMEPGRTGLTQSEWTVLVNYALDGLGLRAGNPNAIGPMYAEWYTAVINDDYTMGGGGVRPADLEEKTASMLLRDLHKNQPHVFAGIVAAAPLWAQTITEGVTAGDSIGIMYELLQGATEANALARSAELLRRAEEIKAAGAQAEKASRESSLATEEKSPIILIIIVIAILIAVAIIIMRRRR